MVNKKKLAKNAVKGAAAVYTFGASIAVEKAIKKRKSKQNVKEWSGSNPAINVESSFDLDDEDELTWEDVIPDDPQKSIQPLKDLIAKETDPLVRHEMVDWLAAQYYRLRDKNDTALDDFDELVESYHEELVGGLRQEMINSPGFTNWLYAGFYKQASIRQQKLGNTVHAKTWAKRGLWFHEKFGTEMALADLQKRASK